MPEQVMKPTVEVNLDSKKEIYYQPQSLKKLAAEAVKERNPNVFFRFHNEPLLPEIQKEYVEPLVQGRLNEAEEVYLYNVETRDKKVKKNAAAITNNKCFERINFITSMGVTTALYVGTGYLIMQAAAADLNTRVIFYATSILPPLVVGVTSPCWFPAAVRSMINCLTPSVPREIVDFDVEAQKVDEVALEKSNLKWANMRMFKEEKKPIQQQLNNGDAIGKEKECEIVPALSMGLGQ